MEKPNHVFEGAVEGYTINYFKRHLWRLNGTHYHEDAMQEARVVFLRCAQRYPDVAPAHFMALYKTSLANEVNDLSKLATDAREALPLDADDGEGTPISYESVGELDNDGALAVLIRQAPTEVKMVLNLFLTAPQELVELAMRAWRRKGRYKDDGEKAISQMLGLPAGTEPMRRTAEHFDYNFSIHTTAEKDSVL